MPPRITILRLVVDGMTCSHCETTIEKAVGAIEGVTRVRASAPLSEVMVYHEAGWVTREQVVAAIIDAGYTVRGSEGEPKQAGPRTAAQETARDGTPVVERPPSSDGAVVRAADASPTAARPVVTRILGLLALVAAAFLVAKATGGASFLPTVSQNMGYGLLF
ncbi:MAG TPA: heavy-metal-associated domain-containing protein, partial [Spirochaetia bacterium]